jgi:hypothetical protein
VHTLTRRRWWALEPDSTGVIVLLFGLLLIGRALGVESVYFLEEDEVSLAVGSAALVTDTAGGLYRYTVQVGYYRLIEALDLAFGGRVDLVPWIMKGLSAVAGAAIPISGLLSFRYDLSVRERWLFCLLLTANPIIWHSSRYGNTAIVAMALAAAGTAIVSNRPRGSAAAVGLVLIAAATLVRADTVLLAPLVLVLSYRTRGTATAALLWTGAWILGVALAYWAVLAVDPRADSVAQSVSSHMAVERPTLFWEYLLWALSPAPAVLAIWGGRQLLDTRPGLFATVVVWAMPSLLFYARATWTPRYFLQAAVPLSLAAAVGMGDIIDRLQTRFRPSLAWLVGLGVAFTHLFVSLGHVPPGQPAQWLKGASFRTDDGWMPTGALVAQTYLSNWSLVRNLKHPTFGASPFPYWEGVSFTRALTHLQDPAFTTRRIIIVLSGGYGHAFHYHTQVADVRYVSGPPPGALLWEGETWFEVGNRLVMTIAEHTDDYRQLERFAVEAGDEVWIPSARLFPTPEELAKVPAGLTLSPIESFDSRFQTFRVVPQV